MSMWRTAMSYLGFGPDGFDEDEYDPAPERPARGGRAAYGADPYESSTVRAMPSREAREPREPREVREVRDHPVDHDRRDNTRDRSREIDTPAVAARPRTGSAVRTVSAPAANPRPHHVSPTSFNEAQEVGDRFREGQPVIVNLQEVDSDLKRRLIDFASGLCYALDGKVERVANGVYLLTPANVQVSDDDRRRDV
jgi:cell division inhibitor SepF